MNDFWVREYLGNTVQEYTWAVGIFVVIGLACFIAQRILLKKVKQWSEKTQTHLDDAFVRIVQTIKPPVYLLVAFWFALKSLELKEFFVKIVTAILIIVFIYLAVRAVQIIIDELASRHMEDHPNEKSVINLIKLLAKFALWSIGVLLVLSNLGVNITSLVAGLGIGGIAVALALQTILSDLFSSFALYFDKPFVVGDFIVVGNESGVVQDIGIKTTRIRSLQGEEIVMSNRDLTSQVIHNYRLLEKRRVVFKLGIVYETAQEKLERIPSIIETIIKKQEGLEFSRAHFTEFGDSALMYEVVYSILSSDYNQYMDTHQRILLEMNQVFASEGIRFAYPAQTVYLQKN